ncbi:hypothetical protein IJG29_03725 [Candidatus Saccharibacteria bacterium]|nr:hypothetical protein [Candidatus Saccharibacteria bacterium]
MKVIQNKLTKSLSGRVTGPALRPALLILGAAVVSLLHINLAHAESDSGSLTITAEKSLTVTVPGTTNLSIHPTENGAFNTADINIIVNSNNRYGYNLNMTTATTSLTGNAPLSSGNYPVIESISGSGMTCTAETGATCNFTKDKWGYKLSTDTTYSPIQANTNMLIKNNTNESAGTPETSTVTFGARLSNATPAGSYSTTITFIATINNPTAVGGVSFEEAFDFADKQKYNGYYAMQDMDATICGYVKPQTNVADYTTTTVGKLIDKRDNEIYVVGKLASGECWMLDNLRLGGDNPISLSSEDSDLPSGITWTLPKSGGDCTTHNNCTDTSGVAGSGFTRPYFNSENKNVVASTHYGSGSGVIGNAYNFCALSGGTYCYAQSQGPYGSAAGTICPKNWSMPRYLNNTWPASYNNLYRLYGNNIAYFLDNLSVALTNNNSASLLWGKTNHNTDNSSTAGIYTIDQTSFTPGTADRYIAGYIRCLLK